MTGQTRRKPSVRALAPQRTAAASVNRADEFTYRFFAFVGMAEKSHASIEDILLLFIYLEMGAMVGIYFKTNHMPVRFLIYVAITALTRMLIADIQHNHQPGLGILYVSGAILLLAFATLVIRFGSYRYPASTATGADGKSAAGIN